MKQYQYFIERDYDGNLIKPKAKEGFLIKKDVAWIYDGDTPYLILGPKDRYLDEYNKITKNREELGKLADIDFNAIITSDTKGTIWNYEEVYEKYNIDKNLALFSVRLANINADEIERDKNFDIVKTPNYAEEAVLFVENLIKNADDYIFDFRIDKESGMLALDTYGRPIAILYVRHGDKWINVNRSLIKNQLAEVAFTEYSNLSLVEIQQWKNEDPDRPDKFSKLKVEKELEDDREIYLGEFNLENEVVIGDVKFNIPPTHIQVIQINESNPAAVLRHQTTLQGSVGHQIKQIQMEIYFNGLEDINGTPIEPKDEFATIIRDGETIIPVYYINGLRSLIAQFMLTPFLPIDNEFLNLEKDIFAVTLQNITLTNVKGFPNVIKATLTLLEFNYLAYLDIPPYANFSDVFDWKLFRFYYQRLLEGTGMRHNGTQLPLFKENLNTNNFWFEVVSPETLQTKEDYIRLMSSIIPAHTLDYIDGESQEEINLHDYKSVQVAQRQLQLYKDKYYEQFVKLKQEFELGKMSEDEYRKKFKLIARDFYGEAENILDDIYGLQSYKFKNYELYYDPFLVVERPEDWDFYVINDHWDFYVINDHGYSFQDPYYVINDPVYSFQDPYNDIPVFRLPLRDPVNQERVNTRFKEYKEMIEKGDTESIPKIFLFDIYSHERQEGKYYFVSSKDSLLLSAISLNGKNEEKRREKIKEMAETFQHDLDMEVKMFPNLMLTDIAVSISNKVNTIKLNMQTSPAHQYLGGKEVLISLNFIAKNKEELTKFDNMISYVKAMETRYANILDMPIMRFHHDMAKLTGIDAVGYQDYVVSTIPNMPGAYEISITLIGFYKAPEGFESVNKIYQNKIKKSPQEGIADYFELKEILRYVELYPDLELPKYNELPINSYLYDPNNEEFVDPDFYAIALTTTFAEYVEEALNNPDFTEMTHLDSGGNQAVSIVDLKNGYVTTELEDVIISNVTDNQEEYQRRGTRTSPDRFVDTLHDIFVYCKKGRLVRAFPTFYIMLIDEGERLWWWRLHDNFYEYNGVKSIDVVRSRKIAADTCMIHMSNSRGNLTKAETDYKKYEVEYSFFEALWKMTPWEQLEEKRIARSRETTSVQLEAGARIHLRIGYGSSPADLPILFNGTITEINIDENEDVIFVAQSDAIELLKPLQVKPGETIGTSKEPAKIIGDMLQKTEGRFWHRFSKGKFYKENALGLEHFGSGFKPDFWNNNEYFINKYKNLIYQDFPDWMILDLIGGTVDGVRRLFASIKGKPKDHLNLVNVFEYSEITQNIHPSSSNLVNAEEGFGFDDALFNITLYGKTPYDVLQTCAMAAPNFIGTIHPFGFRSTVFFGHPLWDLAYDYSIKYINDKPKRNADGTIADEDVIENVKPYRQLHIYDDFSDIISNQISVSSNNIYTIGKPVVVKRGKIEEFDEVYVDQNIYPNMQKLINIDTSVDASGAFEPKFLGFINVYWKNEEVCAYRITKSALKDYMKEMYSGQLLIIGDPTVKPYDYVFMSDIKNNMSGMFEVEQVIHTFNKEVGFITSITPNPIVIINEGIIEDMSYYIYAKNLANNIVANSLTPKLLSFTLHGVRLAGGYGLVQLLKYLGKKNGIKTLNRITGFGLKVLDPGVELTKKSAQYIKGTKAVQALKNKEFIRLQKLKTTIPKTVKNMITYLKGLWPKLQTKIAQKLSLFLGIKVPVKFVGSITITIALILTEIIISAHIRNYLQLKRDNKQVLTIIPLKKDNKPYIAGLDGHAGCILGDERDELDKWWEKILYKIFDVKESEDRVLLEEWSKYHKEFEKQVQNNFIRQIEQTSIGRDMQRGSVNSIFGDVYVSPKEEIERIEGSDRLEWNRNAYQKATNHELTFKEFKGIPLQAHFVDLLKSLEEELNIELQLSNNPLKTSDDRTDLLYDAGLAVSIDLKNVKGNKEYIKQEIIEKAELGGFYNHGIAAGEDIVHLDLGLKKRWNLNY